MEVLGSLCTTFVTPLIYLGLRTPAMRAIAIAAAATVALWVTKPSYFFTADGKAKIWSYMVPDRVEADSTPVTWWMLVGIIAAFFDLCV